MVGSWIRKTDDYPIATELYSGPLDLLLDLIQKAELDISKLALAEVTDQFLAYVHEHEEADPEYISEFLVIASKLVQIKSEAILPHPPVHEPEEEDLGEELARQLRIYREIKNTTKWLQTRLDSDLRTHLHLPQQYLVNVQFDLSGIEITDLILALENLDNEDQNQTEFDEVIIPKLTLRKKITDIVHFLRTHRDVNFSDLLQAGSNRIDTIVVFLAILELVKQHYIEIKQDALFSEIQIQANLESFEEDQLELVLED